MGIRAGVDLKLDPLSAFQELVDELCMVLPKFGMQFEPGPGGRITEGNVEVGRVISWQPGEKVALEWHPTDWQLDAKTKLEVRFETMQEGTRITLEHENLDNLLGDPGNELAGWFVSEVAAPLLCATGPSRLGDWLTDRRARRPSGPQARQTYRDPIYHRPNFKAILKELALKPDDYLLEVGCGGGAFLEDALRCGCKAAAIDHSPDMVRLAQQVNRDAIEAERLEIRQGEADSLPYQDRTFTCAVMTGVFAFIPDPVKALSEVARVLAPGGRFAMFTGSKELRGTPAAPEPIAARLFFYEDAELEQLARQAGFREAHVERPDFEQYAREAGVPEEAMPLFSSRDGPGYGQLLLARR
jgi:ubiquinone/menaquinone biosynthesis C-methylase UbiE